MILVIGGFGFIGSHTTRALLHLGEPCLLTQHRSTSLPSFLQPESGGQLLVEQADVLDLAALRDLGRRHTITGIVYLAGQFFSPDLVEDLRVNMQQFFNVLQAGLDWKVDRVTVASTIGVYGHFSDPQLREDTLLSMAGPHPIPAVKKSFEILADTVAVGAGLDVVCARIAYAWGPLGRSRSRFAFAAPQLVHAAVSGDTAELGTIYADEGADMCYVKDCGGALALLQTAAHLRYRTYNVGSGAVTSNREVVAAIMRVAPETALALVDGRNPQGPPIDPFVDIERITTDAGYSPAFGIDDSVADYVAWLRAGNER